MIDSKIAQSQRIQSIILVSSLIGCAIEAALMPFYESMNFNLQLILGEDENWGRYDSPELDLYKSYSSGFKLQLASNILLLIGFIFMIVLTFTKSHYRKIILIGDDLLLVGGLILGAIGMGKTTNFFVSDTEKNSQFKQYDYSLAFWFIDLVLTIMIFVDQYALYKEFQTNDSACISQENSKQILH